MSNLEWKRAIMKLKQIQKYMNNNELWNYGWMNPPIKPERTPKRLMKEVIDFIKKENEND